MRVVSLEDSISVRLFSWPVNKVDMIIYIRFSLKCA